VIAVPLIALYPLLSGGAPVGRVLLHYIVPVVALALVAAAAFQAGGDFLYWFNLGQPPHDPRLRLSIDLARAVAAEWRFWLIVVVGLYLGWRRPAVGPARSALLCLILVAAVPLVTLQTSGLPEQTRMQGVPLILLLLYRLAAESAVVSRVWERLFQGARFRLLAGRPDRVAKALLVLLLLAYVPPAALMVSVAVNASVAFGFPTGAGIAEANRRLLDGSYAGVLMRKAAARDLGPIRGLIAERGGDFVNLSELTFLYADFRVAPPKGLPLWFDYGISFFEAEMALLTAGIVARAPAVILLQDAHSHADPAVHKRLASYYLAHGYALAFRAEAPRADRPILVLTRNP